jgi:hypothetical protein
MLSRQSQSPSSPSKRALDELIKGCEPAIYNTAFTLKELNDLRAESQVQATKKESIKTPDGPCTRPPSASGKGPYFIKK